MSNTRNMPIIWTGAAMDPSGYGEATRGYLSALYDLTSDRRTIKLRSKQYWHGDSIGVTPIWNKLSRMHAAEADLDKPHFLVQHLTPDNWRISDNRVAYHVGVTTFETDRLPHHWLMPMRSMDELWTFSRWSANVFREMGIRCPINVVPHGVDVERFKPGLDPLPVLRRISGPGERGIADEGSYVFGSNFDFTERKNPGALLRAYFRTFDAKEGVCLVLKAYYQHPFERSRQHIKAYVQRIKDELGLPNTPRVAIHSGILPWVDVPRFYAGLDAYVLPSRGEGWGLTYSEAMASGLPVIATNWSGNTEFMHDHNSILLPYKLATITPQEAGHQRHYAGHQWANVDEDALGHAMRSLFDNREYGKRIGEFARRDMVNHYTWDRAAQTIDGIVEHGLASIIL